MAQSLVAFTLRFAGEPNVGVTNRPIAMFGITDEVEHDKLIRAEDIVNQETFDESES